MKGTTVLAASKFHSWSIGYFKGFSSQKKSDCSRKDTFILKVEQKKKTKHLFFHCAARGVDKPAADCELEPNNQSAVVSIVMLSPIGRGKNGKGTHDMSAPRPRLPSRDHTNKHTKGTRAWITSGMHVKRTRQRRCFKSLWGHDSVTKQRLGFKQLANHLSKELRRVETSCKTFSFPCSRLWIITYSLKQTANGLGKTLAALNSRLNNCAKSTVRVERSLPGIGCEFYKKTN